MEYGNQGGRRVDEYGNPIPGAYNATGAGAGAHGMAGTGAHGMTGTGAHGMTGTGAHGMTGVTPHGTAHPHEEMADASGQLKPVRDRGLRRSGSGSSSSSSEDDGMGGRRKKGIKEKIKEKLPGGHKTEDEHRYGGQTAPMTTVPPTMAEGGHEKKGMMEKIKEKLPGNH